MKDFTPFKQLILMLCLFAAGTWSPSNGVDEGFTKNPVEMILESIGIVIAVLIIYKIATRALSAEKQS